MGEDKKELIGQVITDALSGERADENLPPALQGLELSAFAYESEEEAGAEALNAELRIGDEHYLISIERI